MNLRSLTATLILVFCLLAARHASAGEPVILSSASCSLPAWTYYNRVAANAAGDVFVTGDKWLFKHGDGLAISSSIVTGDTIWDLAPAEDGGLYTAEWTTACRYDLDLVLASLITLAGTIRAVTIGSGGYVYLAGCESGKAFVAKCDPYLNLLSSAVYSAVESGAFDVTVDAAGNVFISGYRKMGGNYEYLVAKFDSDLRLLADAGGIDAKYYADGSAYADSFSRLLADAGGNVFVVGMRHRGTNTDWFSSSNGIIVKYDTSLQALSSATFNVDSVTHVSVSDAALDEAGNLWVGGATMTQSVLNVYDHDLHRLPVEARHDGDCKGNYPRATVAPGPGGELISSDLVGTTTYILCKYRGSPAVRSLSLSSGMQGKTLDVTVTGVNFLPDTTVSFGDGITINSVDRVSATQFIANISVSLDAVPGTRTVTTLNSDGLPAVTEGAFTVLSINSNSTVTDPSVDANVTIHPLSGNITVSAPAGTFDTALTLAVTTAAVPASGQSTVKVTAIGIEITNSADLQPNREITFTVYYRDSDIAGLDENKLSLARYDNGRWIPIPTIVYADQNKLVGTVKHLSTFAVVQLAPAADLAGVKCYPNPFNPKNGPLTLANLTGEADIKIYDVAGELVRTLAYTSANGQAIWDGKNDGGSAVSSGVYLAFIKSPQGKKILKIAVER